MLIAVTILSVGIVTVLCAFHTSLSALGSVREGLWAGMLIREKMAALEGAARDGDDSAMRSSKGQFGGVYADFRWETAVSDMALPEGSEDDRSCALKRVDVWVWRENDKRYSSTGYLWIDTREAAK